MDLGGECGRIASLRLADTGHDWIDLECCAPKLVFEQRIAALHGPYLRMLLLVASPAPCRNARAGIPRTVHTRCQVHGIVTNERRCRRTTEAPMQKISPPEAKSVSAQRLALPILLALSF